MHVVKTHYEPYTAVNKVLKTLILIQVPERDEVPMMDNPITVALDKCQRFVLRPYTRLLTLVTRKICHSEL